MKSFTNLELLEIEGAVATKLNLFEQYEKDGLHPVQGQIDTLKDILVKARLMREEKWNTCNS